MVEIVPLCRDLGRAFQRFANDAKTRAAAQKFTDESCQLMEGMLKQGGAFVKKYLGDRKFKFVLGAMRTGGTFLYKELCDIHEQKWDSLNLHMTHDSIPTYGYLAYWQKSQVMLPLLFEMAQFFVWVKRELESDIVIQKRIAYMFALPFLQSLFADSAEYYVTVRHPLPLAYSFSKVMKQDPHSKDTKEPPAWYGMVSGDAGIPTREQWGQLSYFEKTLDFWREFHLYAAASRDAVPNMHIVTFGDPFNQFLDLYREHNGTTENMGYLNFSEKTLQGEMDQNAIDDAFEMVDKAWSAVGLTFKEPDIV